MARTPRMGYDAAQKTISFAAKLSAFDRIHAAAVTA